MRVIGHELKPLCIGNNEVINVYKFGEQKNVSSSYDAVEAATHRPFARNITSLEC